MNIEKHTKQELLKKFELIIERATTRAELCQIGSKLRTIESQFDADKIFSGKKIFLRDEVTDASDPKGLGRLEIVPFAVSTISDPTTIEVSPRGVESEILGIRGFNREGEVRVIRLQLFGVMGIQETSFDWSELSLGMTDKEKLAVKEGRPEKLAERYFPIRAPWPISSTNPVAITFRGSHRLKGMLVLRSPAPLDESFDRDVWRGEKLKEYLDL